MKLNSNYNFRVNKDLREKFKRVCKDQGVSPDGELRRFMTKTIKEAVN